MLRVTDGLVVEVLEERDGIQTLAVFCAETGEVEHAIHYFAEGMRLKKGDRVVLNVTAVRLGLGTGGQHFVVARHNQPDELDLYPTRWGHIMKLRYTPSQLAVDAVEEPGSPWHARFADETLTLERTPVLVGELHSLLPALALSLHELEPGARLVYVMPDGASLPIGLSRHVHHLKQAGILSATVTAGHAWGGDVEAVNLYTGLLAAKHVASADYILCLLGPGVAGTGTPLGFSGMQTVEAVHAASLLDGIPMYVPRIGFADERERHLGLSHHTRTVLKRFTLRPALVPFPLFDDHRGQMLHRQAAEASLFERHFPLFGRVPARETINRMLNRYPLPVTSMGRDVDQDPAFVYTAYIAAEAAVFAKRWAARHATAWSPDRDGLATLAASWVSWTNGEA